jgi:hypothetical protein
MTAASSAATASAARPDESMNGGSEVAVLDCVSDLIVDLPSGPVGEAVASFVVSTVEQNP